MTIKQSYSPICGRLIAIKYQLPDEYKDVDEMLKFDTYEDSGVFSSRIFDTHPNKGSDDRTDFNVDQDFKEETPNFN